MKIGQEVLMRAKVTEIHETSNGCEYTLIAYHDDAKYSIRDIRVKSEDVETCRHCNYLGEIMCVECESRMVTEIGGV